jgi:hypothetical protein
VRKAVENHGHMRITSHNLWISMWTGKMPGKTTAQLLRATGWRSRKAFTVRNGHCPGATPGSGEGTLSYSARHKRLGQDRQAAKHSHAGRRPSWISPRKNRAETDPPEGPGTADRDDEDQTGHASLR